MFNYTEMAPHLCEYIEVAPESDLPNGARLFVEVDELAIVLFKISGKIYAIADTCSHDNGPLGEGELQD